MLGTQTAPGAGAARSEFNGEHDSIKPAADRSHHRRIAVAYDVAGAGEFCTAWAEIDVALVVEDKVGSAEGPISADLSHIGTCGVILRFRSHLSGLTAP
jgi:hypothetical protein